MAHNTPPLNDKEWKKWLREGQESNRQQRLRNIGIDEDLISESIQSEGLVIPEGNGLINTAPIEAPPPVKKMTEEERERIWYMYHGKLGLSGDDWVEHLEYSNSLNLPYDASKEDRIRVSKLKTEDLIRRMTRSGKEPEKVTEWLGEETYDWYKPEKVGGRYRFPNELSLPQKVDLTIKGALHNAVQGFDNPVPFWEGIKKKRFPNWQDFKGILDTVWD